jgi:putative salt-induced outer membrane protein YdiY
MKVSYSLAFTLVVSAGLAQAQTPPPAPTPPPLWSGKAELAYAGTSGNTDTSSLGTGFEVAYRPAPWTVEGKFAYLRASTDGVTTAEALLASARGSRDMTPRIDLFVQAAYGRNTFAGIDARYSGEAGAGYKILTGPDVALRGEMGFGYTHENRTTGDSLGFATGRAGFKFVWKFSKFADFTDELSWTESFANTSDWLLRNAASVSATLTSLLSLKVSYVVVHDNVPVPGFKKTDTITAAALVAKF